MTPSTTSLTSLVNAALVKLATLVKSLTSVAQYMY